MASKGRVVDYDRFAQIVGFTHQDTGPIFYEEFPDGSTLELWMGVWAGIQLGFIVQTPSFANDVGYEIYEEYPTFYDAVIEWKERVEKVKKETQIWKVMVEFRVKAPSGDEAYRYLDDLTEGLLDGRAVGLPEGCLQSASAETASREE